MSVTSKFDPFPHIIVDGTFNEQEYSLVWKELMFLYPKMQSPEKTGAGITENGEFGKRGKGVFLRKFYVDITMSDIFKCTRKLFSQEIRNAADSLGLYFNQFERLTTDSVLVQLYYNGDYYVSHDDFALFSMVTLLHKTPKQYTGGELVFPQYNYNPSLKNNQTIIFPSLIKHEVTEVKMQSYDKEDGRFTISQLCNMGNFIPPQIENVK